MMGPQVFVLDEDNVARARTVQLGELAGPWQILVDGLESGERVVVSDPGGLEPGTPIDPQLRRRCRVADGRTAPVSATRPRSRQGQAQGQGGASAEGGQEQVPDEPSAPAEEDAAE